MIFRGDLHLHSGPCPWSSEWHGGSPTSMAEGIVRSNVDVYAVTNHHGFSETGSLLEEEIARLLDGTGKRVFGITGVEISIHFGNRRFHVNHLCTDKFPKGGAPVIPKPPCTLNDLAQIREDHPGVTILNHPVRRSGDAMNLDRVHRLIDEIQVEGLEIINGAILQNTERHQKPKPAISRAPIHLFQQIREGGRSIAAIGSSDAHRGFNRIPLQQGQIADLQGLNSYDPDNQVGSAITEFCAETPEGIFDEIRMGRTCAIAVHDEIRGCVRHAINNLSLNGLRRFVRVQG